MPGGQQHGRMDLVAFTRRPMPTPAPTINDLQQVAPLVLQRLKQMGPLPPAGTVAGQAVASLFFEALGLALRGPINDIDAFVDISLPREDRGLAKLPEGTWGHTQQRTVATVANRDQVGVGTDNYEQIKFIALRASTVIRSTYQVGIMNYTLVANMLAERGQRGHSEAVSKSLVEGFDLNLVQVGINLESERVVASDGFLQFLADRKIRVATCNTPAHTLVRLAAKVFGGQIQGASCDYAIERNMLEVALAAQGNDRVNRGKQPGQDTPYIAPLQFGGNKYKRLHERFAQHLPPTVSKEMPGDNDASYLLYSLKAQAPDRAEDLELVEISLDRVLHPTIASDLFVTRFPQVYDLFHPERCTLPDTERKARKEYLTTLIAQSRRTQAKIDVEYPVIRLLKPNDLMLAQQALGGSAVHLEPGTLTRMDEDDHVIFFHGQDCARTPEGVQMAINAWNEMPDIERHLVMRLEAQADATIGLAQHRATQLQTWLHAYGHTVLRHVHEFEGWHEENLGQRGPLMAELLSMLHGMGEKGQAILDSVLPINNTDQPSARSAFFGHIIAALPEQTRGQHAHTIMVRCNPGWPLMPHASGGAREMAMVQWWAAKQEVPQAFWDATPDDQIPILVERICNLLKRPMTELVTFNEPALQPSLAMLAGRLTPEQMADHDGRLVRAMLGAGQLETLIQVTEKVTSPLIDGALNQALSLLEQQVRDNIKGYNPFLEPEVKATYPDDDWKFVDEPKPVRAALEAALMQRRTAGAAVTRSTRGMRL